MEYYPSSSSSASSASSSFAGKTLVIPVVSHGNVGQLASDLMVNTSGAARLGCLDHPALLPCVGCGAFSGTTGATAERQLALGMEVYGGGDDDGDASNLVVAQQRAEVVAGAQREFARDTARWIADVGFAEVFIMASIPSTAGVAPEQIGGTRFRHVTTSGSPDPRCEKAGLAAIEPDITPDSLFFASDVDEEMDVDVDVDGGGAAASSSCATTATKPPSPPPLLPPWSLLRACKSIGVKATCVVAICSEGDNSVDAAAMADAVCDSLGVMTTTTTMRERGGADAETETETVGTRRRIGRWKVPPSWATAFGAQPMNRAIFV